MLREEIKKKIKRRINELLGEVEHILIASETCPSCKVVIDFIKTAIEEGKVKIVYLGSDEFKEIDKILNIQTIPTYVVKERGEYKVEDLKELLYKFGEG